ncbi:alpha-glucuronidase family glycosyl hydrolase [Lysobacter sp.]|uniref:alpha-glucuronidase family glycosyl hydrolase n=1 Tax=Lysobacter sp. TaxID=72226 RepID=UPI002D696589|nr:alpha-glucuronidase family glycosyl hydrolase [Lysobacter sp.]HZX78379.1 alpha-glucuronidase family glycosyl hydrolase [Lysobacter sp.]
MFAAAARADEDGYQLWLRYRPLPAAQAAAVPASAIVTLAPETPTVLAARTELQRALGGMLGRVPQAATAIRAGSVVLARSDGLPAGLPAELRGSLDRIGPEGYLLARTRMQGQDVFLITAKSDIGLLYGSFAWLRALQDGSAASLVRSPLVSNPALPLRVLNHWDNLDRSVERGYAGQSIWNWWELPAIVDPRYLDYARANASLGINGTVLNNVNAKAEVLSPAFIAKAAAVAKVLRPYGIRVFLSVRWSTPLDLRETATADPLDPAVAAWWRRKTEEIYRSIPDFGGFLVKANSEGQPGPQDYGRNHVDGANMLARALAPHGGTVMWRAFVYEPPESRKRKGLGDDPKHDRAAHAYDQFKPLDGKFDANVLVQVKNGAIDFQPREPFHPLFGAMPKTPLMMEFQITKEYLGFATHLAYLGPMYEETLRADTHVRGKGSTVAKVVDGSLHGYKLTGMAGVANIGSDRNWSGSHFDQANWYVYGRLAWNPALSSRDIAEEWTRMTFSNDADVVQPIVGMMMGSREAVVDYMTPMGLHHLMGRGHHYGPGPWVEGGPRADWTSVYYHRATKDGIGFDRTRRGSDAVSQYAPPVAAQFDDVKKTPEQFLLWFHHLPWDYTTQSGRPLWDELVHHYSRGVDYVRGMRRTWDGLEGRIDPERHAQVATFLAIQEKEAQWWRDGSIAYFQTFSGRPLPAGEALPPHALEYYESLEFPFAPGNG